MSIKTVLLPEWVGVDQSAVSFDRGLLFGRRAGACRKDIGVEEGNRLNISGGG